MTLCTSCGTENAEGMKFCVKCGAALAPAPDPGAWRAPSGNLYDTPAPPSGGLNEPRGYATPPVAYTGYGGMVTSAGIGGLPYAEWVDRVLAALIDGAIAAAVMFVLYFIFGAIGGVLGAIGSGLSNDPGGGAVGAIGSASCCLGFLLAGLSVFAVGIYNKVFLVSKRGFSIGQGVMKLKVTDQNGNIPQVGTLLLRLLVQVALGFIPIIGAVLGVLNLLWPLWDEKKQTLHDKAVGTFVLKTGS